MLTTQSTATTTTRYASFQGTVAGLRTGGGFTLQSTSGGKVSVLFTSSTVISTSAAPLAAGSHTIVLGTGSTATSITAAYVALYPTTPSSFWLTGSVSGATPVGFDLKTTTYGIVPILLDTQSGIATPATGASLTLTGVGSPHEAMLARSSSGGSTGGGGGGGSISQTHILTGDYLGTPWGTTKVSPSQAAPYVDWVRTDASNGNTMHAAGLKVQAYFDPNRVETKDPLYSMTPTSSYATVCAGSRVYVTFAGLTQFVPYPGNSAMQTAYRNLVESKISGQHIDAVFEDNAGPLTGFGTANFKSTMPCSYSDSVWVNAERELEKALPVPTIFNGLSGLHGHDVSLSVGLLQNPSTIGGEYEHCFSDDSKAEQAAWVWTATENTQLQVTHLGKIFQCEARDTGSASSSYPARIYTIASFLLTYDPNHSVLWEEFATNSGFHVMPETELVPMSPLVASPSNVSSLEQSTSTYLREYRSCYLKGKLLGACAMAVNNDYYSHPLPHFTQTYHHTLVLHGSGVLDGGYVSEDGPMPSSTMAAQSAVVLLP